MVDFPRIVEFVYNVYGENNVFLANLTLKEMGINPATRRPTLYAVDGAKACRVIEHFYVDGVCAECGSPEPPRN